MLVLKVLSHWSLGRSVSTWIFVLEERGLGERLLGEEGGLGGLWNVL